MVKFHYIASDTKLQFDLEWNNPVLMPFCSTSMRAIMNADYIPGIKCRWCPVVQEKFENC